MLYRHDAVALVLRMQDKPVMHESQSRETLSAHGTCASMIFFLAQP
jgi:hypothetical protein